MSNVDIKAATAQEVIWAQVDLDAIAHNVRQLRRHIGDNVQLMAVVKDNAYGHGAQQVAPVVLKSGADRLAVARMAEGIQLRRGGVVAPILVLGYLPTAAAAALAENDLTPAVTTLELGRALSAEVERLGRNRLPVHVKVDSGMGRFGVLPDEAVDLLRALSDLPGIRLEGMFTHFSTAELADQSYSRRQLGVFLDVVKSAREAGFSVPLVHAANSPATLYLAEAHLNMVRPGLPIYGWQPSAEMGAVLPLLPALSLHSRVARVRVLPPGSAISYGNTYITTQPTRVALVPIGYGDGYRRTISNRGAVLIRGQRCRILGRVCMDQLVVDVSGVPHVRLDDEVVALGRQGDEQIGADEIAAWANTISYEVITCIMPRVPRVYLQGGRVVEVRTLLTA